MVSGKTGFPERFSHGKGVSETRAEAIILTDLRCIDKGSHLFHVRNPLVVNDRFFRLKVDDFTDEEGVKTEYVGVDELAFENEGKLVEVGGVNMFGRDGGESCITYFVRFSA